MRYPSTCERVCCAIKANRRPLAERAEGIPANMPSMSVSFFDFAKHRPKRLVFRQVSKTNETTKTRLLGTNTSTPLPFLLGATDYQSPISFFVVPQLILVFCRFRQHGGAWATTSQQQTRRGLKPQHVDERFPQQCTSYFGWYR